ncbi:MFS transporter [Sulfitobacter albidus]|uniref:MFS transporter n=1 Tax=Sulfitobacter albidus TaxID=2829501 RepID=A0A975JE63_9RHOB|nr:MFS transporter [Sulfitobacter albidus]QUJ76798.1 MFS transporter [Sulfitobacter albidus]
MQTGATSQGNVLSVLRSLSPRARLFLWAMALTRLTGFMVFPFLTVILSQQLGASIVEIGSLFTVAAFVGLGTSPVAGFIADRISKKFLMQLGVGLTIASLLAMGLIREISVYYGAIILMSVAGGMLEPLLRSTLGELAETDAQRPALFHLRYYMVNIAGAIGPVLGLWFIQTQSPAVFFIAAASFVFLAGVIHFKQPKLPTPADPLNAPVRRNIWVSVLGHRMFVALFVANFLLVFIYAQTDEPLTFHMIDRGVPDIAGIVTVLTVTNTVVVLVLHGLFMNRIMAMGEGLAFRVAIGCLCLSLVLIAANGAHLLWIWIAAIAISTLGEIIAMPMFLTIVDRIAPAENRNAYFGIYMLSNTGGALAPFLAASLITGFGGTTLFIGAALCCIPLAVVGAIALRHTTQTPETESTDAPL